MAETSITQDQLKELLRYDPITGDFVWLVCRGSATPGKKAGMIDITGYHRIRVMGKFYQAHRLAVLYMEGSFPATHTDHIDGNRSNNTYTNLRCCDYFQNNQNRKIAGNNKTGIMGVYFDTRKNLWLSEITSKRKRYLLGGHKDLFEACCARKSAELKHGFHPNHGRRA